mgnify:CR=1 FL=1
MNIHWINSVTAVADVTTQDLETGDRIEVESRDGEQVTVKVLELDEQAGKAVLERVSTGIGY